MPNVEDQEHSRALILQEAAEWCLRQEQPDFDPSAFARWQARSAAHQAAWQAVSQSWAMLPKLATAAPARAPRRRRTAQRVVQLGTLIAALWAGTLFAPELWINFKADHLSGWGEVKTLSLVDGSQITLAPNSALSVALGNEGRQATLLRGEAYFQIAHDPTRPFTVAAGAAQIEVLGTAFNLRLGAQATDLALQEGAVRMLGTDQPPLRPGERALVNEAGMVLRAQISTQEIGSWRQGEIFLEDVPLAEALALIAPWHPDWLMLIDPGLGQERVTGLIHLNTPEAALSALLAPVGAKARRLAPKVLTLSRI